ncbi:hypothetical protein DPMN_135202 [Dreissena polymorpha]|uniref:Uncharacterized protein n=1 Tax=Dreissena polymorpha TaxID=45954 RepID=A0A9D4FX51_DREPO|nr:hypothetical protein DPMN_135202 [Dreissena polymorpha]
MSRQLRAAALLRQAAVLLNENRSAPVPTLTPVTSVSTSSAAAARAIFGPYTVRATGGGVQTQAVSHWTQVFHYSQVYSRRHH